MNYAQFSACTARRQAVQVFAAVVGLLLEMLSSPARAVLPIQHWETAAGAQVYFVESRGLPILDVSVEFPAGSSVDTPVTSGLAGLTLRTMQMGAGGLSEDAISERLADAGAVLSLSLDVDRAGYRLRMLSGPAERETPLATLAKVLAQPAFDAHILEREKARVAAGLREAEMKPDHIATRNLALLLYRDHPYALNTAGEVRTVRTLTRDQLVQHHRRFYLASQAVVAIMGDVRRDEAAHIAEQLTAGLPRGQGTPAPPLRLPPLEAAEARFLEHPAAQAHILIGGPGMGRLDPDYFPLFVGNYILGGGGFNSRFMHEVREKRGLSYSVYSQFSPYRSSGAFIIGLQTRRDQAAAALEVVRTTLREFVAHGPTPAELEDAREHIIGGFPLRIDSNREIVDYLAVIGFYGLPLDYLEQFPQRVAAITAEQVRDAFRRRIDPDRLATVVVGAEAPGLAPAQ